ncbi:Proline-Rich Protein 36, partial [Manis pentadactyla]
PSPKAIAVQASTHMHSRNPVPRRPDNGHGERKLEDAFHQNIAFLDKEMTL